MSGHTPGPWEFVKREFGAKWKRFVYREGRRDNAIADVCGGRAATESDGNAYLIAAAPDLLAAAQDARDALRDIRDMGPGLIAQHGDALDRLLLAIRKARGEQPAPHTESGS